MKCWQNQFNSCCFVQSKLELVGHLIVSNIVFRNWVLKNFSSLSNLGFIIIDISYIRGLYRFFHVRTYALRKHGTSQKCFKAFHCLWIMGKFKNDQADNFVPWFAMSIVTNIF